MTYGVGSDEVVVGHRCEVTTSESGECIHTRILPTEAIVDITLETGGMPRVLEGGIAVSGIYHIHPVSQDHIEAWKAKRGEWQFVYTLPDHSEHEGCDWCGFCFCSRCGAAACGDDMMIDHLSGEHLNCPLDQ